LHLHLFLVYAVAEERRFPVRLDLYSKQFS